MGSDFNTLPIIDISPLMAKIDDPNLYKDDDVMNVARKLDEACKETGFFYVTGHGVTESMIKKVREITRKFMELPANEKLKIKMTPETGYRGYQSLGESITKGKPDMHESIECYRHIKQGEYGDLAKPLEGSNLWPENPRNLKATMEEYISLCKDICRKILRGIALGLGCPINSFEGSIAGDVFWVLRLIGYPVSSDIPESLRTDTGIGAHTDYGLLTLVNQDEEIQALQVQNKHGEWMYAVPIPGTFVCNIGDMLKVWTNGIYEATLHRVINNTPHYRVSVAFFYESNFDACIEADELCKKKTGGVAKYEKIVYGEHLVKKVISTFLDGSY